MLPLMDSDPPTFTHPDRTDRTKGEPMNLNLSTTVDDKPMSVHVFEVDHLCQPLPCALCGRTPLPGEKVMETNRGEAKALCCVCASLAMIGFEDLDRMSAGFSSLVSE